LYAGMRRVISGSSVFDETLPFLKNIFLIVLEINKTTPYPI